MDTERQPGSALARWWAVNRARLAILAVAALAGGGIVCMMAIVLILIARR